MDSRTVLYFIIAAVVALVIIGAMVWFATRRRQREHLRQRFGPEYEHAVAERGDERRAVAELQAREKRVAELHIRPLEAAERERAAGAWKSVQARFVDDPPGVVSDADRLIGEVMAARGYPMADFEQRAADLSVQHAGVVTNYRAAHDIAERSRAGRASTEDLRQSMVHYRSLFAELVGEEPVRHQEEVRVDESTRRTSDR